MKRIIIWFVMDIDVNKQKLMSISTRRAKIIIYITFYQLSLYSFFNKMDLIFWVFKLETAIFFSLTCILCIKFKMKW